MLRAALVTSILALIAWKIQALSGFERAVLELFISGRLPGTDFYLSFEMTVAILAVPAFLLIEWMRAVWNDFMIFSLDIARQEAEKRTEAQIKESELVDFSETAQPLGDEELDPVSA